MEIPEKEERNRILEIIITDYFPKISILTQNQIPRKLREHQIEKMSKKTQTYIYAYHFQIREKQR